MLAQRGRLVFEKAQLHNARAPTRLRGLGPRGPPVRIAYGGEPWMQRQSGFSLEGWPFATGC